MSEPSADDKSVFPDPVYVDTVLRPLFDGVKTHHVEGFRQIDRAHLVMLAETGILDAKQAGAIASALVAIDAEVDPAKLVYDGSVEDYFFAVERELIKRLGPDLAGRLHTARSRNDIDHTLFRLALKARLERLIGQSLGLLETLIATAEREKETLIVAYTHGQPAQPSTFGHYLSAIIEVLVRDTERLFAAYGTVDKSPMGAAAITTSGFPIDRARVADLLGFAEPVRNSYSAIAAIDYVTSTYGAIELMFLHLGRPIQDFQFWSSFEAGQLYVPNALVQISSIMPQKRNPVPIEHLRLLTSQTLGRAQTVLTVMHNTPFTDMNDSEGETQAMGYEAFDSAARVLDLLTSLIGQVKIDPTRVAEIMRRSCITVTELADSLVREEGLSFRQGHEIAAAVARAVVAARGAVEIDGYAPFVEAFERLTGRQSAIGPEWFAEIVSPEHFVAVRARYGGPAVAPLSEALVAYGEALASFRQRLGEVTDRKLRAAAERDTRFKDLMESH